MWIVAPRAECSAMVTSPAAAKTISAAASRTKWIYSFTIEVADSKTKAKPPVQITAKATLSITIN